VADAVTLPRPFGSRSAEVRVQMARTSLAGRGLHDGVQHGLPLLVRLLLRLLLLLLLLRRELLPALRCQYHKTYRSVIVSISTGRKLEQGCNRLRILRSSRAA
jgi:hypothetical protein